MPDVPARNGSARRSSYVSNFSSMGWLGALVLLVTVGAICLGRTASVSDDSFDAEASRIQKRTIPSHAANVNRLPVRRTAWSVTSSWEFEVKEPWSTYREWVRRQFDPEFKTLVDDDSRLEFGRSTVSDTYSVNLQMAQPGPPTRIVVTYIARAE